MRESKEIASLASWERSEMTMSYGFCDKNSQASTLLEASCTSYPALRKLTSRMRRLLGSLSTKSKEGFDK